MCLKQEKKHNPFNRGSQMSRREFVIKNIFTYLKDFPPALFIKHSLFEMHLKEKFGFLNLLLCDHWA